MALNSGRLNTARFNSIKADLQIQFPLPSGLQASEASQYTTFIDKMAHAIADNEGTDVVGEIVTNARVPVGIDVLIPSTASPGNPSNGATIEEGTII